MSYISILHFIKLIFRSCLLVAAAISYAVNRMQQSGNLIFDAEHRPFILFLIWLIFVIEMVFRFFPSRVESMGCQKQFKRNYKPTSVQKEKRQSDRSVLWVAVFWIFLNGIIGVLRSGKLIDDGILLLISLVFSVCDMICILFFCPFQTWFMKNKCCTSCRIYNWDYAMMFTPLLFTRDFLAWSLFGVAFLLLLRWELTVYMHPERFSEETNACLACSACKEKLCQHKKQLRRFWKRNQDRLHLKEKDRIKEA